MVILILLVSFQHMLIVNCSERAFYYSQGSHLKNELMISPIGLKVPSGLILQSQSLLKIIFVVVVRFALSQFNLKFIIN